MSDKTGNSFIDGLQIAFIVLVIVIAVLNDD